MKLNRALRAISILVLMAGIFSCSGDNGTTPPTDNTVIIGDDFYNPQNLFISVGRTVVWRHEGATQHTVTSGSPTNNPGGLFDSGLINTGGGFQFTLNAPGTYPYFCRVHGVAHTGTITVQ
ncbi:MAG TPA: plastocyanin/azurin family copper-binding protein [Acidobacteriota bacterium]|nr:plastocyanin/azurin family copper-binding protein [Acidobacteriota bacterium]